MRYFIPGPLALVHQSHYRLRNIINIDVLAHLIISETDQLTFADLGIIAQMKASDTWRLVEKEEIDVRKIKEEVERKEIEKNKAVAIAKKLKKMGLDDEKIKKSTGLSLNVIKKLNYMI